MDKKKGQVGTGSAMFLIILITLFIILYILFLPPEEREELLGLEEENVTEEVEEVEPENLLLKESPGTIYKVKQEEFIHSINSFSIFTRVEDMVLKDVGSLYVSKSKFSEDSKKIILVLDDVENTKNVMLSFYVKKHRGRLIVLLNDDEIFNSEVTGLSQIRLENVERENLIEIKASDPGIALWGTNYYELTEVKITGRVINIKNQEAINAFYLNEEEIRLLEDAALNYFVDCSKMDVGVLRIYVNGVLLSSDIPDCGSFEKLVLDKRDLKEGRNELRFFTEHGYYLIDQAYVKTELEEPLWPVYYFEINSSQWTNITDNTLDPILTIEFVDDKERKVATLNINGHERGIDTYEATYSRNIEDVVKLGNNYVRIVPDTTLYVVEIRIELK